MMVSLNIVHHERHYLDILQQLPHVYNRRLGKHINNINRKWKQGP